MGIYIIHLYVCWMKIYDIMRYLWEKNGYDRSGCLLKTRACYERNIIFSEKNERLKFYIISKNIYREILK